MRCVVRLGLIMRADSTARAFEQTPFALFRRAGTRRHASDRQGRARRETPDNGRDVGSPLDVLG